MFERSFKYAVVKPLIRLFNKVVFVPIIAVLWMGIHGCDRRADTANQITVGVSYQNFSNEFLIKMQDAIRARSKQFNIHLIELDAQGRSEQQIAHVENFIARNVDAIILNPVDVHGSAPAVDIAVRDHKPVVVVNTIVSNLDKVNAYVGSPDVEAGRIEASEIMRLLNGRGNIAVMQGIYGHSAEVQRTNGIREVLATYPDAKIVAEQTGNWDRAQALTVMENWLSAGNKIDGVIAENDEMAMGALEAIYSAGKQNEIIVIGIDGIRDALKAVAENKLAATVFQDPVAQGILAVELTYQIVKGRSIKSVKNHIPFQLVTKENVHTFLK